MLLSLLCSYLLSMTASPFFLPRDVYETAVFILCTSCRTEFWVIQQNRKYFPEAAETAFLRSRPETTPALTPGQTSWTAKSEVDSRLPARHSTAKPEVAPDFWPDFTRLPRTGSLTSAIARYPLVQPGSTSHHGKRRFYQPGKHPLSWSTRCKDYQRQRPKQETQSLPDGRKPYRYSKNLGSPWTRPRSIFSQNFKRLLFEWTLWKSIYQPNLKLVALSVPEIIGGTQKIWALPVYAHAPFSPKFLIGFSFDGLSEYICQIWRS